MRVSSSKHAHTAVTPALCVCVHAAYVCMQLPVAPYAARRGLCWQGHKYAADAHTTSQLPATPTAAAGGSGGSRLWLATAAAAAHLCCQAFLQLLLLLQQIVQLGAHLTATPPAQQQRCDRACQRRQAVCQAALPEHLLDASWCKLCRAMPCHAVACAALCCAALVCWCASRWLLLLLLPLSYVYATSFSSLNFAKLMTADRWRRSRADSGLWMSCTRRFDSRKSSRLGGGRKRTLHADVDGAGRQSQQPCHQCFWGASERRGYASACGRSCTSLMCLCHCSRGCHAVCSHTFMPKSLTPQASISFDRCL